MHEKVIILKEEELADCHAKWIDSPKSLNNENESI
jgi:hypothetical protein